MSGIQKDTDKQGAVWTITSSPSSQTHTLEVWNTRTADETVWIRQENNGGVDLISLDLGQAYDLIIAISEALNNG